MRTRRFLERRNAHQSGDREPVLVAAGGEKGIGVLRQNAGFRPTRGRYKIYIIDEVHMLSKEAFCGRTPAFCASAPVLISTNKTG